jgi:hypothetical protein
MTITDQVLLRLPPTYLSIFIPLLAEGVEVRSRTGISLYDLLCDRLGMPRDYVDERIQTIFVNGRAVDRLDEIALADGTTVALSAAMPGLVGATLRRGGHLAAMRREISQPVESSSPSSQEGWVTVKLFNKVGRDMGGALLQHGIWLTGERLAVIAKQIAQNLEAGGMDLASISEPGALADDIQEAALVDRRIMLKVVWGTAGVGLSKQ